MNCQSFETVVNDLAREQTMEASVQADALRHSSECEICGLRLHDERALTGSLREFSRVARSATVSPQLERSLLDEFRQQHSESKVVPIRRRRLVPLYAAAAAAMIFGFAAVVYQAFVGADPKEVVTAPSVNELAKPAPEAVSPSVTVAVPPAARAIKPVHRNKRTKTRSTKPINNNETVAANYGNSEVVSEFIPIGYATAANVEEGAQLVRVEMPRSAMARFGMPVNMERVNERVKADVLVSADGLPRAIRFVQ